MVYTLDIGKYGKSREEIHSDADKVGRTEYISHLSNEAMNQMKMSDLFTVWTTLRIIGYVSSPEFDAYIINNKV